MAILPEDDLRLIWRGLMTRGEFPGNVLKADLRAAVDALDAWVDANAAALNAALPQPFRGQATVAHKALLLAFVALRRAGKDII